MIDIEKEILNVVFSSDDNYAQHLGVAIYSLLVNNKQFDTIRIFIINNQISEENKKKIVSMVKGFSNTEISWIEFEKWEKILNLNVPWSISISAYARIFIDSMLPKQINKVMYMDCDMIVCQSLKQLWNVDLENNIIGAIQDTIRNDTKLAVGLDIAQPYFNSGMLLIDLYEWRKNNVEKKCLDYIEKNKGFVIHHDQGVLNNILKNKWKKLDLKYNLMTIHFLFDARKIKKYYNDQAIFYNEKEIYEAKKAPVILHFTPSFTCRPWIKGCHHPLRKVYWNNLSNTPWKNVDLQDNDSKWYIRLLEWRYRKLPY